jgi:HAD superfamily hydrolase (TIGR01509 family)
MDFIMKKNRIQSIIFDLDGTLIDTEPSAALAITESLLSWNIAVEPEDSNYVTGRTWESAFSYLFKKYPLPLPEAEAKRHILEHYRATIERTLTPVPGSVEAVTALAASYPLGLVSGSNRNDILWALQKLNIRSHFKVILGAEDYPRSKPQPDGYLKAIETLGHAPESCLVFEDSTAGISSARAAGLWVVAVTLTNHFHQDLSLAHFKIRDLTEVTTQWIQNLTFE